ncbi:CHASE2 domain-containing protein [Teichococcus coralli]|uniref:CHASE2 domain-containing protein n=1 Tax=Teichococcus coralli TaxID=2545983 RepID=UPI00136F4ADC
MLLLLLVCVLLFPLRIANALDQAAYSLASDLLSFFYPTSSSRFEIAGCEGRPARDCIVPVLIDDYFVESSGSPKWPVGWDAYPPFLAELAKAEPAAVFLDLLFEKPHAFSAEAAPSEEAVGEIAQAIRKLRAGGTKVVLASRIGLPKAATGHASDGAAAPGCGKAAAGTILPELAAAADAVGAIQWTRGDTPSLYPARIRAEAAGGCAMPTAAFAIFGQITSGRRAGAPDRQIAAHDGGAAAMLPPGGPLMPADAVRGLLVTWGVADRPEPAFPDAAPACPPEPRPLATGLAAWLSLEAWQTLFGLLTGSLKPCSYHAALSADDVQQNPRVRDSLRGKVVLVGTALTGDRDVLETPFGTMVPGVMLHAMALDNLLTWPVLPEVAELNLLWGIKLHSMLLLLAGFIAFLVTEAARLPDLPGAPILRPLARGKGMPAALLFLLFAWTLGLFSLVHLLLYLLAPLVTRLVRLQDQAKKGVRELLQRLNAHKESVHDAAPEAMHVICARISLEAEVSLDATPAEPRAGADRLPPGAG